MDLAALYASFTNPQGRAVIAKIAQRSLDGETAAYGELAEHADLNFNQLRARFAWFSKKGKALKGTDKSLWPMTVTDAGSKAPKGVRYRYQMPRQIAV